MKKSAEIDEGDSRRQ